MNNLNLNLPPKEDTIKGSIWNVEQGNTSSTGTEIWANRPAIIVSNEATNQKAGFVLVVYLTTKPKRQMPYHVSVFSGDKQATALCEQIFAVDKSRLSTYIGQITPQEMLDIDKALLFSLGISNTIRPTSLFSKWINAIERYSIDLSVHPLCDPIHEDTDIMKQRDMYKQLYEQERNTVSKLLAKT